MKNTRIIHNGPPKLKKKESTMKNPPEGFTTKAKVVNVVDGDTVDVVIERRVRVRLQDCWCPETRTRDIVEKQKGIAARSFLITRAMGRDVTLHIPADDKGELKDVFTFGRVVGRIFVDNFDVSEMMIEAGHATKEKKQ